MGAAIVLAVYASTFVEIRLPQPDPRPNGTLEDVRALASRDDLNVLFVLIDTLRADRMSVYGYARETSPFLEQVAAEGVLFERHLAQSSWTKCSMASLWTGLYPPRTGITRFNHALPEDAVMPAEIFRDHGFRTTGIYRNGWVSGYFGFEQGFDIYIRPTPKQLPPSVRRKNPTVTTQGTDLDVVESAAEFLRLHGDGRWMLYLHFMDVHEYTYTPESALFGTTNSDVYDNSILHTDYVMETLFSELATQGLLDKTLIVITSDHGEAFGERGIEGHAREVHRETTEVPWIVSFPFRLDPGVVVPSRTANVDIWPTVLDLVGLPVPDDLDGTSLRDAILSGGGPQDSGALAYAYLDQTWGTRGGRPAPSVAVTDGALRFVVGIEGGKRVDSLFDAETDPLEKTNLAAERTETTERLKQLAREHLDQEAKWEEGAKELEIDEMELNQLRALGYSLP